MKLGGEWAKRANHKIHILSSRLIFFSINHIHIQMTCLSSLNQAQTRIYGTSIGFDICIFTGKITWLKIFIRTQKFVTCSLRSYSGSTGIYFRYQSIHIQIKYTP
jgi:hypothetical protein